MATSELVGIARVLSKPINDIYDLGKEKFKKELSRAKTVQNIKRISKSISSVHKVKTIWQVDKEVSLKSFYYPPRVIIDGKEANINTISKLPQETNCVIQGIVGQGKSIFLRYLSYQEAMIGTRIPIFFELRRIEPGETLKQNLLKILDSFGFDTGDDIFTFLCDSGRIVFLLDGFDEIPEARVNSIIKELELLSEKHSNLRIIVSSRPGSGIERSTFFRVFSLSQLNNQDLPAIIEKLIGDKKRADEIIKVIRSSGTKIKSLLTTPLMVTLLVLVYKSEQKIPEQLSEFYENLFPMLLYRHDKSKPGYIRKRETNLNERKLQQVFEAFSFISRKKDLSTISSELMHSISEEAFRAVQVDCDSSKFINDITKVTNLILEEGYRYHFIHKSVQEFHAANYIKGRPDEIASIFYASVRNSSWHVWRQELKFLSQIDTYRYIKHVFLPDARAMLDELGISENEWLDLKESKLNEILEKNRIAVESASESATNFIYSFENMTSVAGPDTHDVEMKIFDELMNLISDPSNFEKIKKHAKSKTKRVEVSFFPILRDRGLLKRAYELINSNLKLFLSQYKEKSKYIEQEDKNKELMII